NRGSGLEAERVLELRRHLAVGGAEPQRAADIVLDPALIEREEEVVARLERPSHAALPSEVAGPVVVLNQVRERQPRRDRVVDVRREDAGDEAPLGESREGLVRA